MYVSHDPVPLMSSREQLAELRTVLLHFVLVQNNCPAYLVDELQYIKLYA